METWMTYEGENFIAKVPTDWLVTSSPRFQAIFLSNYTSEKEQANFMVSLRVLHEGVTTKQIASAAKTRQQNAYPGYDLREEGLFHIVNGKGFYHLYQWSREEDNLQILQRQVFVVVNGKLYTLTSTQPGDALINNSKIENTLLEINQSFTITE